MTPVPGLRPDLLADLAALGSEAPRLARAAGAGGGAPVFSGCGAPGAIEGRTGGDPEAEAAWAERAAILEFDGGWPRATAEALADRLTAMAAAGADPAAWAALDAELIAAEWGRPPPPLAGPSPGPDRKRALDPEISPVRLSEF